MQVRTNLTSDQIRDGAIESSIPYYLRPDETREGLLKKFDGNLIKLIQYLREREFENLEPIPSKPIPLKKPAAKKTADPIIPVKSKPKKKPSPTDKNQSDLF